MRHIARQKGIISLSTTVTVLAAVVLGVLAVRLLPVYYNDYAISQVLQEAAANPTVTMALDSNRNDLIALQKLLYVKFNVNNVSNVNVEQVQIVNDNGTNKLTLEYNVQVPMLANISALVHFNHEIQVKHS